MKHLLLDINIVLDLWLQRGQYESIEELIEKCDEFRVKLWFSSSSLGIIEYILIRELKKEGASENRAKGIARELLSLLLENVSLLSNYGFEQYSAIQKANDLEDAQIALSFNSIHGPKRIVTRNASFDTLGLVKTCTVQEACKWINNKDTTGQLNFIDLKAQQDAIQPQLEKTIQAVLHHGRYILGPEVPELERRLCEYTGAKHCIGVSSGTDALLMSLMAWGVGPGDAVFTTPFTFIATAEVIQLLGATPVFVDIDPKTFNIDPARLKLAIQAVKENNPEIHPLPESSPLSPKVVVPVDLFGLPADYDPIMQLAKENDLFVLSDSAQGFGSEYKGQRSGTYGHATATSFFPAKPLGCYGDGGAIFTDDDGLAGVLESIRMHGKGRDKYDNIRIGLNARLDTIQAAILLPKLEIFPRELGKKQRIAEEYTELLIRHNPALGLPFVPDDCRSAWAQYSVLAKDSETRSWAQQALRDAGIPSMVYYPRPLHMQTAFSHLGYRPEDFPVSLETSERIFSLPMHAYLQDEEILEIVKTISMAEA